LISFDAPKDIRMRKSFDAPKDIRTLISFDVRRINGCGSLLIRASKDIKIPKS
jgi:hypothetical protein